jgi:DNA-binding CsgD family transcriptional regulator/tetratricopeptide (TPR) repeat protein
VAQTTNEDVVESAASSLQRARKAARAARYDAALDLLQGCEDWPEHTRDAAIALKAEVLGRRTPVGALEWLSGVGEAIATPAGRFMYELELGRAFANVRDLDSARAHLAIAETLAGTVPDGPLLLAYHRSRLAWFAQEFDPAASDVVAAITHPDPNIAMAALVMRGWHHAGLGDLRSQIADFRLALAMLDLEADEPLDVYVAAITATALARVAFETADAAAMADVRERYEQIAWTDDVQSDRFKTVRTLGWDAFMRGRPGPAQWSFKDALGYAPSTAWKVMARLDRAYVARIAGNEPWALEEIAEADHLGYSVRWESTNDEERAALLMLATLIAPTNAARAQRYASTLSSLGTDSMLPIFAAANGDRRAHAAARFAQGQIDAVLGHTAPAERAFRDAYDIFVSIGYVCRASMAAIALAEVTGEASWREKAAQHASAYPNSPLAALRPTGAALEPQMPASLSPLQKQVARALAGGAEVPEVSRALSRSVYTIERQVEAVYAAFGVRSRSEFLTSARQLGMA